MDGWIAKIGRCSARTAAAFFLAIGLALPALADGPTPPPAISDPTATGSVTAESRFGNGSISGLTRQSDLGDQVQLPNGRWIYCRRSCSETLRVETIDFFEANGNGPLHSGHGGLGAECGIFGCLDLKFPR